MTSPVRPVTYDAINHARSDGLGSAHVEDLRKDGEMNPSRPLGLNADQLDAQAAAFARLFGLAPNDREDVTIRAVRR